MTIYRIEEAPGDFPRAVEQPNGDLLLPSNARPLLRQALAKAEQAMERDPKAGLAALKEASRLLGIVREEKQPAWLMNLFKVRAI
jgi:hypothetical protein